VVNSHYLKQITKNKLLIIIILPFIILNYVAWSHAHAMMYFSTGERTSKPEDLSMLGKLNILFTGVNVPRPENTNTPADYDLSFETHKFTNESGYMLETWYIPEDVTNKTIIIFHGYASSKKSLISLAIKFKALKYSVLLVDFYGSGGSSGNSTTIGLKEASDVTASVKYIREKWPNNSITLYGVSLGGAAILRAVAIDKITPEAIILENVFDSMLNTVRNRFKAMKLPSFPSAELLVFWGGWQQGFNGHLHNPFEYARKVNCPTLVLHGKLDSTVSTEEAKNIFNNLNGKKKFIAYDDVGHEMLATSKKSEAWLEDVKKFISSE